MLQFLFVGEVDVQKKGWQTKDIKIKTNKKIIKEECKNYVRNVVPEVYKWRNKIAVHFAITDPEEDNNGLEETFVSTALIYGIIVVFTNAFFVAKFCKNKDK